MSFPSFPQGLSAMFGFAATYVFDKCTPLSLCSDALAVTLPGFAGEECLPLPRSKGGAFPFLLTLGRCPTASANVAQGQRCSLETPETLGEVLLDTWSAFILHCRH
jgi:hypothetical protein